MLENSYRLANLDPDVLKLIFHEDPVGLNFSESEISRRLENLVTPKDALASSDGFVNKTFRVKMMRGDRKVGSFTYTNNFLDRLIHLVAEVSDDSGLVQIDEGDRPTGLSPGASTTVHMEFLANFQVAFKCHVDVLLRDSSSMRLLERIRIEFDIQ